MRQPPKTPLLHPLALLAVAVMVLNDHVLKPAAPGVITGKLSDVAGLIFFPLLLASIATAAATEASWRRIVAASIAVTVIGFIAVKTTIIGALAFGWSLGAAQWLLALGAFSGSLPRAAVVVPDATDLIALPAALIAWWIADQTPAESQPLEGRSPTPSRRPLRRLSPSALVVIIAAGVATIATSEMPAQSNVRHTEAVHLDGGRPVVARHLALSVDSRDAGATSIDLIVDMARRLENGSAIAVESDEVQLSLIPDEPSAGVIDSESYGGNGARAVDLTRKCLPSCDYGATVILRLMPAAQKMAIDIELEASLVAGSDDFERDGLDVDLAIAGDEPPGLEGPPRTIVARIDRPIRVGDLEPRAEAEVHLRVAPEVLSEPLAFPLVGRLLSWVENTGASGHPNAHNTIISVNGDMSRLVVGGEQPTDVDFLSLCDAATLCEITISVESEYDTSLEEDEDPAPGFVELRWFVETRLEAWDGRALPEGALVFSDD